MVLTGVGGTRVEHSGLLLTNGTVIDVSTGNTVVADILIENDTIVIVDSGANIPSEKRVPPIVADVSGKWLVPGFIDMHVHINEGYAPQFVASGITTVRNTAGNLIELRRLREASPHAPTPRVITADRLLDGPPGCWGETSPWNLNTDDPDTARREVQRQVDAGADLIKVYGLLNRDVMRAVVEQAKQCGLDVSCDLLQSSQVTALEAAQMGVRWNEHCSGFIQDMYPGWTMNSSNDSWQNIDWDSPDVEKVKLLCEQILEHEVILCPTMDIFDQIMRLPDYWDPNNCVSEKTRENTGLIQQWEMFSGYVDSLRLQGRLRGFNQLIAKTYFDLGGTVVTGTDVPAGVWTFPGMALHREMELFVGAGFSTLDTLRAATITAARALGRSDLGEIKAGRVADIVILNANPLEDMRNTQDIERIVKGGRVYTQEEILRHVPSNERIAEIQEEVMKEISSHL